MSARLCCRAQPHTDSSARVLRESWSGGLVWARALLRAEPAACAKHGPHGALTSPATQETQQALPGAAACHGGASPLLYLPLPAREKKKTKKSVGGQGRVMGSAFTKREQAWLLEDEEEGPCAAPHEGVLVWHLGRLEQVPAQHGPLLHSPLVPSRTHTLQTQHQGSNHEGHREMSPAGRGVPAVCHSREHRARCPGRAEPPNSSGPRARLLRLPAAGTRSREPGLCPAGRGAEERGHCTRLNTQQRLCGTRGKNGEREREGKQEGE